MVFFCIEGWRIEVLKISCLTFLCFLVNFVCCTNFIFWKLSAQLSSTWPSLAHDGNPKIVGPGVSAMCHWVCRWFAISCPFGSPVYCCIQCSKLGYLRSTVSYQTCHHWLQSSWWTISIDTSGEQLGKCMQCHDISTCTSVNLAWESQVNLIQSQQASGQSQRIQLLSLFEHQISVSS